MRKKGKLTLKQKARGAVNRNVNIMRIFGIALFSAFGVFSLLIYFWGEKGVVAMDELILYQDELMKNITDLQKRNGRLRNTMDKLRYEEDLLKLRARQIDYYQAGEKVIRIDGWRDPAVQVYEPGRVFQYRRIYFPDKTYLRGGAVLAGLGVLLLFLLLQGIPRRGR